MTVTFKKFLTGTILCVSTFSTLNVANTAFAFQQVEAGKSTLQALLDSSPKRATLSPIQTVERVSYSQTDHATVPAADSNSLQPLLPKLPTPPKFRPSPLLPSIASQSSGSQSSGVPIVSAAEKPAVPVAPEQPTANKLIVPIVSGPSAPQPVVSSPLPSSKTGTGNTYTYPAIPVRSGNTVPVVNGKAVPAVQPQAFAPSTIQPMIPTIPKSEIATAAKQTATAISNQAKTTTDALESKVTETRQQAARSFATASESTNASINSSKQTLEQAIVTAQSEITGDEIQVEEISSDQLMNMIMGPGKIKASNISTATPQTTQQRVATIGSGASSSATAPVMNISSPQEVFSGAAPSYLNAPCDTGYGCDAQRPDMPSCLPYDGCGCVSGATGYGFVDFLYMDRDKGDFSASLLPANDAYGYTPGARVRIGRKYDCIEGWEAGFTILDAHTANTQILSPTNSLSPRLFPTDGFTLANISSFNGASFHESFQKSHFYSAELNKMSWNWDVMSTFIGIRYTGIDDLYGLNSIGSGGDFGTYRLRARNHLIGPQIGGELFYDIGRRLSFSVSGKLGGYVNFYQTNTEFANNNVRIIDNTDEDVDLAWSTEMGVFARYMLTPRAKLKVGYEFWYFDNVASAQGQYNGLITPFSGLNSSNSDGALYHGASFGLEWYR